MSVSKRTRYEVLRRDANTCQYCGGKAPDVELTVDHVVPSSLGGADDPSNLVAACHDCNSGKSSTRPDGPLVEQVSSAAAMFAVGLREAVHSQGEEIAGQLAAVDRFVELWDAYVPKFRRDSWRLPDDLGSTVMRWHEMGVTDSTFEYAIRIAVAKKDVQGVGKFRYAAGIIWTLIRKAEDATAPHQAPTDGPSEYARGYEDGCATQCKEDVQYFATRHMADLLLGRVVDGAPIPTRFRRAWKAAA